MKKLMFLGIITCVGLLLASAAVTEAARPGYGKKVKVVNPDPIPVEPINPSNGRCMRSYYHQVENISTNPLTYHNILEVDPPDQQQDFVIEYISIRIKRPVPIYENLHSVTIENINPVTQEWQTFMYFPLSNQHTETFLDSTHWTVDGTLVLNCRVKEPNLRIVYATQIPSDDFVDINSVVHGYLTGSECP